MATTDRSDLPSWLDDPALWDVVTLGGVDLPGLSKIEPFDVGRKIDLRSPPGSDGGRVIDKGLDLAKLKITVVMWEVDHFTAWEDLVPLIIPRKKLEDRKALQILHPDTALLGIHSVYVEKLSSLKDGPVARAKTATISLVEHTPSSARRRRTSTTKGPVEGSMTFDVDEVNGISGSARAEGTTSAPATLRDSGTTTLRNGAGVVAGPRATGAADP